MKRPIPLLITLILLLIAVIPARAQTPVVKAVLFYSPFCGHCHKVINEDIPPLSRQYNQEVVWSEVPEETSDESGGVPTLIALQGDALQILFVNTTTPLGGELFGNAIQAYKIPDPVGVPALVVGDQYMIGSVDIPAQFPDIIATGLEAGGIDWPEISELQEHIAELTPPQEETEENPDPEAESPAPEEVDERETAPSDLPDSSEESPMAQQPVLMDIDRKELSVRERILLDPVGNTLSILVLIGMVLSMIGVAVRWGSSTAVSDTKDLARLLLILILVGVGVAAYLTYIESTGSDAVCGPVGDCNIVQQSQYALLFGVLPVGALGLIGYAGLMTTWFLSRSGRQPLDSLATIAFFLLASLGTLFSIYLTILEPFVIGATCIWCLSSALIMTVLAILSTDPARSAYKELRTSSG